MIDPASIMPAGTLAYVEIGNPGQQIETLLNMLQGTPLEASLQGNGQAPAQSGAQNIGGIIEALRNPSMISEFKKIRGLALGITGFPQDGPPPFVGILLPGQSDALRGLLTVGLQMVAQPKGTISHLQAYQIEDGPAIAFDDTALIIAYPETQLSQAVKQYTQAQTANLTSNARFLQAAPLETRKSNAITVWVDTEQSYQKFSSMMPQEHMPQELKVAQKILDLPKCNYLVKTLSLQEDSIHVNAKLNLKPDHQCLAYNLIHTPPLTPTGLEAIPANAALVLSLALASPESAQAHAIQNKVQQITGLDIGREIFANIEQLSIFIIPGNEATPAYWSMPQIASQVGIAITSHNPEKTQQLLDQWLSLGTFIVGQASGKPATTEAGPYEIMYMNGQKICCYMEQSQKTTLLSLSPGVIQACKKAIVTKENVYNAGPMRAQLQALPNTASKMVLLNVGHAIEAILPSAPNEIKNKIGPIADTFSKACANTVIQINTVETSNSLGIHIGLTQLPKISEVLPAVMKMANM